MDHFKPHPKAAFEGYYSKFRLPSGANLAIIVCKVRQAKVRPNMVSVTYVSEDSKRHWQREYWPESIEFRETGSDSFEMSVPGIGRVSCGVRGESYDLETQDFKFHAQTVPETREPWLKGDPASTPAGLLVHAPLPIQWHVHTLASKTNFTLEIVSPSNDENEGEGEEELRQHADDREGQCTVHHEKNWAQSFPSKYIWIQAWDESRRRGLCVAGGEALPGVEAYLLTYTRRLSSDSSSSSSSSSHEAFETLTFTPLWTFGILGFSPFCVTRHDYQSGTVTLDVSNLTRRIRIHAVAPRETFFQLSAPLPEGHRPNFACESFAATHTVTLFERDWVWQAWRQTFTDTFRHASLEFGGGYYDDAGKKTD